MKVSLLNIHCICTLVTCRMEVLVSLTLEVLRDPLVLRLSPLLEFLLKMSQELRGVTLDRSEDGGSWTTQTHTAGSYTLMLDVFLSDSCSAQTKLQEVQLSGCEQRRVSWVFIVLLKRIHVDSVSASQSHSYKQDSREGLKPHMIFVGVQWLFNRDIFKCLI